MTFPANFSDLFDTLKIKSFEFQNLAAFTFLLSFKLKA
jgi:hypothetical protein